MIKASVFKVGDDMKKIIIKRLRKVLDIFTLIIVNLILIYSIIEISNKVQSNNPFLTGFVFSLIYFNFVNIQLNLYKNRKMKVSS